MNEARLIGIDWGTTNFRAYLLDGDGAVLDKVDAGRGILNVADGAYAGAYLDLVGQWQSAEGGPPALMAGMIGSRNGWVEAAYVDCPADPASLAERLQPVPFEDGRAVWIVPGLACRNDGVHDVIRGEETQIAGAVSLAPGGADRAVFCLPGTHSKWVSVRDGAIAGFRTAMTGEVFSVLKDHSILGRLMAPGTSGAAGPAFAQGLDRARDPGGLLHHLFGVRAEALFDVIDETAVADYLSGILIGHEIRALGADETVTLIGSDALTDRYRRAVAHYGHRSHCLSGEQAVIAGLLAVARQAGIIRNER